VLKLRYAIVLLLLTPTALWAQNGRPEVIVDVHHDMSPPLREMPPGPRRIGDLEAEPVRHIPSSRTQPLGPDAVLQKPPRDGMAALAPLAPTAITNFDGIGNGFVGPAGTFVVNSAPPDTNGAVGPNHVVEVVNTDFAVFNKAGTPVFGPVPINTLWSGFANSNCGAQNDGDPVVVYDRIADRWIISQFQVSVNPSEQCVAVSATPDPTGSYFRYTFKYGTDFPDYPKMGVWPDGYYITYNVFTAGGAAFLGGRACVFDRANMLAGAAATQVCFDTTTSFGGLLPADLDGRTLPAAGAPEPFIALGATSTTLALWKFHADFAAPLNSTFAGPTTISVPAYAEACAPSGTCIPEGGSANLLDSLSDRLMYRAAYRNFGDHEAIVVNHSVTAGASVGVRWYELRGVTTTPTLFQSGTFAPDATYRWMGSAAMDSAGNIAIGYSASSSAITPQIRVTGRLAGDPAGQLTLGETTIVSSGGAQLARLSRWGDYSSMSVDPSDDCTFYYSNEYIPATGTFNWKTRIASFKLSTCGGADFSLSASPTTVNATQGGPSGTSTITVAPTGGFTGNVTLSVSGLPTGATASFTPNPTTSTSLLAVSASAAAVAGTYPLTVTGTSGALTHTTSVSLVIAGPPDFALSASPASVTVPQGSNRSTTITVTKLNGFAGAVDLSVTGLPPGATGTFNPTTTTTTSTLTLTVDPTVTQATYNLTVTGTSGALTHTTMVALNVVPPADFSISASPTTVTAAQGASAPTTITVTPVNGFNGAVALSVTGLPTGATGSFNPASTTSTSVLTLDAGTAATGTYTLTITGTSGALSHTTTVDFTVTAGQAAGFSVAVTPAALTVQHGKSGSYAVTITRTGGFAGAVALSVSGQQTGVTATFNPASATGNTSTLNITAIGKATRDTVTLTITGTAAGFPTATTTVSLTIR